MTTTTVSDTDAMVIRGLAFPQHLGGFVRGRVVDNEAEAPGLGVTIPYDGGAQGKATIYVYGLGISDIPDGPLAPVVRSEFESSMTDIQAVHQHGLVEVLGHGLFGAEQGKPDFLSAGFVVRDVGGLQHSYLFLTGAKGFFLKIRLSMHASEDSSRTAGNFALSLARAVRSGAASNHNGLPTDLEKPLVRVSEYGYELFGLIGITLFGPWRWQIRDLEAPSGAGFVFGCYPQDDPREVAYLLVADATDEPEEPDVRELTPEKALAFEATLEQAVRSQMEGEGRKLIKWMRSQLNDTPYGKGFVSGYIAEDAGRERQYIDVRMPVKGRKLFLSGCFDIARADELAGPVMASLRSIAVLDRPVR